MSGIGLWLEASFDFLFERLIDGNLEFLSACITGLSKRIWHHLGENQRPTCPSTTHKNRGWLREENWLTSTLRSADVAKWADAIDLKIEVLPISRPFAGTSNRQRFPR